MADTIAPVSTEAPQSASDIVNADDATFAEMFGLDVPDRAEEGTPTPTDADTDTDESDSRPRDDKGRFARADEEPEAVEAPAEEATPEEAAKKPMAAFKAFDKDGELDVPADLEIEFKADGELRKVPLDKLIRHAQNGVYNERLVAEVKETREQSPEAQLEKYQQAFRDFQAQQHEQQETQQGMQFVTQGLEPRMMAILEANPEVSWEEAFGRFSLVVAPLMRGGKVPTENFQRVIDLVENDIGNWVAQRAQTRREGSEQARKQLSDTQREAREAVAKQKRTLARALAPNTGKAAPDKARAKPVTTADEGMDAIIGSIMSQGI